jgi:pyrroloquinoline quinone biosynthesis protein D
MTDIAPTSKPSIGRGFRLQWEPAQNAHVLLYPEGMVKLNVSAAIVEDLEQAFNATDLGKDVAAFMVLAMERKWLEMRE